MELKEWMNWYTKILDDFGFIREDDEHTAEVLNNLIKDTYLPLSALPVNTKAIVFGAGPSLKKHIQELKELNENHNQFSLDDYLLISADGATTALLEENLTPQLIVTDLDGRMEHIKEAISNGSIPIVHGHGNNLQEIKTYVPELTKLVATTQSIPLERVYNIGGFTDGDRAVYLAAHQGAQEILLAGMDFGDIVTNYSRPENKDELSPADDIKKLKLKYASQLIDWLSENTNTNIINLCFDSNPYNSCI